MASGDPQCGHDALPRRNRVVRGVVSGALLTTAVALSIVAVLAVTELHDASAPRDRPQAWQTVFALFAVALIAGPTIGVLGGLAARLPARGVPLPWSLTAIAVCAGIARLATAPRPKHPTDSEAFSYAVTLAGALVGAVLVTAIGDYRSRNSPEGSK